MKTKKEDIDSLIKETLTQEEAKFYEELEEQGIFGMLIGLFSGKNAWLLIIMNIITLVAFALSIYCTIQFFNTDSTNELIKWAIGGFLGIMMVCMLKIFAWMQMNNNALLREIKRLELLVSTLKEK